MEESCKIIGAVAQLEQEFFNMSTNLQKACDAIKEAGRQGADIIVFSECYLGQYPYWAQYHNASMEGHAKTYLALHENAIHVKGEECAQIGKAAREAGIYVVMGCNELSDKPGSATIYNSLLFFNRNGELMGRHRKLMPTHHERLVHGQGDARDLRVYETDIGILGGLICWEHHMTLSKYTMATMGEEIHVAVWPGMWRPGDPNKYERVMEPDYGPGFVCDAEYAIREYATETGNFVLSASGLVGEIPSEWKDAIPSLQSDWGIGGSSIVAPGGQYLVEPVIGEERILYAELDFNDRRLWKSFFDPIGHYARPDVYSLLLHKIEGHEYSYKSENDINYTLSSKINLERIAKKHKVNLEVLKNIFEELKYKISDKN